MPAPDLPQRMILQCRPTQQDGWRTVVRFWARDAAAAQRAADAMCAIGQVWWRVVVDDRRQRVLAIHDGRRWQAVAEADTVN